MDEGGRQTEVQANEYGESLFPTNRIIFSSIVGSQRWSVTELRSKFG